MPSQILASNFDLKINENLLITFEYVENNLRQRGEMRNGLIDWSFYTFFFSLIGKIKLKTFIGISVVNFTMLTPFWWLNTKTISIYEKNATTKKILRLCQIPFEYFLK